MAPEKSGSADLFARMREKAPVEQAREAKLTATAVAGGAMARRTALAAESIMENERLTSDLDDDAAKVLVDWGIACTRRVVQRTAGMDDVEAEEAMYPGLRATRRLMRSINDWIEKGQEIEGVERLAFLDMVVEHATIVYGDGFAPPSPAHRKTFLRRHLADTPPQLIAGLREFIEGECAAVEVSSGGEDEYKGKDII
jgi:hypothetical protein